MVIYSDMILQTGQRKKCQSPVARVFTPFQSMMMVQSLSVHRMVDFIKLIQQRSLKRKIIPLPEE